MSSYFKNPRLALLLTITLTAANAWPTFAQQVAVVAPPAPDESSPAQRRQESFEIVWKTVNEKFYDPTFGGVDWKKVHERYAPVVAQAKTDQEVNAILQQMISELHQSHFVIIPKESIPKLLPRRKEEQSEDETGDDTEDLMEAENDDSTTPLDRLGYKMTERLTTGIGIDLRILNGSAVITRVAPASAAAHAGLRPGYVIKNVSGRPLDEAITRFQNNPAFHSMYRGELPVILLAAFINGERRSPVRITFLDGRNVAHTVKLTREKLNGEMSPPIGNLPAMYTEFESRRLPGGFGYIRFNAFVPIEMKKVCAALRSLHDAPGLIFDLRGNQGGLLGMIGGLSGLLEKTVVTLGVMRTRTGESGIVAFPQRVPYDGPIVILIDGSSQSAAEMFAGGLQETGRAVVVGEQSAGNTLPSTIMKLPTGALFQFGFANYQTLGGTTVEGHGITPDVEVTLKRRSLLLGSDPQMLAATRKIRELARWTRPPGTNAPKELIADATAVRPPEKRKTSEAVVTVDSASASSKPPPAVRVIVDPPPPMKVAPKNDPALAALPSVDEIIDRYVEAIGGRAALEKLTTRISKGTVELQSMGLTGETEIYEQAPSKSTVIINIDGLGTIQQTSDGAHSWMQHPLEGYLTFPANRTDTDFRHELHFKELHPGLRVIGKEKIGEREAFVLQSNARAEGKFYFDVESGLLLRNGNSYLEDYRDVDGVKIAFKVTDNATYGFGVVVRLSEIKHNVPIDAAKFAESPDCFTRPEQDWSGKKD